MRTAGTHQEPAEDASAAFARFEDDLSYLARRANQERELAKRARCPKAVMAHRYLAAAYIARIADQAAQAPPIETQPDDMV